MQERFYTFHPVANLIYFICVIGMLMICTSPAIIIIGLISAAIYTVVQRGIVYMCKALFSLGIIVLAITIVNPLFNHRGVTEIYTLKSGNKITVEAIFFGFISGLRLSAVILWFDAFIGIFTSDKHMYVFGRIIPGTGLVISMILSFIPRFMNNFKETYSALNGVYRSRIKCLIKAISSTVTWSFESSVHTARSMKARGYGNKKRSMYKRYEAKLKDYIFTFLILVLMAIVVYGQVTSYLGYIYYPIRMYEKDGMVRVVSTLAYAILSLSVSLMAVGNPCGKE